MAYTFHADKIQDSAIAIEDFQEVIASLDALRDAIENEHSMLGLHQAMNVESGSNPTPQGVCIASARLLYNEDGYIFGESEGFVGLENRQAPNDWQDQAVAGIKGYACVLKLARAVKDPDDLALVCNNGAALGSAIGAVIWEPIDGATVVVYSFQSLVLPADNPSTNDFHVEVWAKNTDLT